MTRVLRRYHCLKTLFVLLYIAFYASNTLFLHTHKFVYGTVTHSHPYSTDANGLPNHSHNSTELQFISLCNTLLITVSDGECIVDAVLTATILHGDDACGEVICREPIHYNFRAPPFCVA